MKRSISKGAAFVAGVTSVLAFAGCASTGDVDELRTRVNGLEAEHRAMEGRIGGLEQSVADVRDQAAKAAERAAAAEAEAARAAQRAEEAESRADAMFKKSVSK